MFPPLGGDPAKLALFHAPGTHQWVRPEGATMLMLTAIGAGGGGGSGASGPTSTGRAGGGGGATGGVTTLLIPAALVPPRLWVEVGAGGAGGVGGAGGAGAPSSIRFSLRASFNALLVSQTTNSGGGAAGSGTTAGAGGTAPTAASTNSMPFASLGVLTVRAGQAGQAGATGFNGGGSLSVYRAGLPLTPGGGGGSINAGNVNGVVPQLVLESTDGFGELMGRLAAPTIGAGDHGQDGWFNFPPFMGIGGGGGSNSNLEAGGDGGNGGHGCGGGGGGPGTTGGSGGRGGDGVVIISWW